MYLYFFLFVTWLYFCPLLLFSSFWPFYVFFSCHYFLVFFVYSLFLCVIYYPPFSPVFENILVSSRPYNFQGSIEIRKLRRIFLAFNDQVFHNFLLIYVKPLNIFPNVFRIYGKIRNELCSSINNIFIQHRIVAVEWKVLYWILVTRN